VRNADLKSFFYNLQPNYYGGITMNWEDTGDSKDIKGGDEDDYEGIYSPLERKKQGKFNLKNFKIPFIFIAAGILILIILFFIFTSGPDESESSQQIRAIEEKLVTMEDRFLKLEKAVEEVRIEELDKRFGNLRDSLERLEASIFLRMDSMTKQLSDFQKKIAELKTETVSLNKSSKVSKKRAKVRIHKVVSGETLYRIGLKYGLTVNQLLKLNNLDSGSVIYPGQKLKVSATAVKQGLD